MTGKAKAWNRTFRVGDGVNRIRRQMGVGGTYNRAAEDWLEGTVITEYGVVEVYSQGDANHSKHTELSFAIAGTCHVRSFQRRFSKSYLKTLAKRFANEIFTQRMAEVVLAKDIKRLIKE
jgi:hypothetical protein